MGHNRQEREKQYRKGIRSIAFGVAILVGYATYKTAEQISQLQDFEILIGLVVGATVFAVLRRILL